jgi:hypothetical protein
VRFLQPARRVRLALQALAEHRVVGDPLGEQFEGDHAVLDGVLGLVDLAHAALADQAQQAVGPELAALPRRRLAHGAVSSNITMVGTPAKISAR